MGINVTEVIRERTFVTLTIPCEDCNLNNLCLFMSFKFHPMCSYFFMELPHNAFGVCFNWLE